MEEGKVFKVHVLSLFNLDYLRFSQEKTWKPPVISSSAFFPYMFEQVYSYALVSESRLLLSEA